MKPLLYLTYRQFVNGTIRALSNPRRLIGLLFFVGYWFWLFAGPAFRSPRGGLPGLPLMDMQMPPLRAVEALIFGIFAILSLFMYFGVAAPQGAFKPADVDVLFPTPVNPRVVLVFRIVRDYLITLVVPFILVAFGLRPVAAGWEAYFRDAPQYAGYAARAAGLGWILVAMSLVCATYAASLFVNRSDLKSDRNRRILYWGTAGAVLGIIAYVSVLLRGVSNADQAIDVTYSPILRAFFLPGTLATNMVMGALDGQLWRSGVGFLGLIGIIALSIRIALSQTPWMYDQAAARGFGAGKNIRKLQQSGDMMGVAAEMARRGKVKVKRTTWVHRIKAKGPWALLWKEAFLQTRGMLFMIVLLAVTTAVMVIVPVFLPSRRDPTPIGIVFLVMQGFSLMSVTLSMAQIGFIEVLRRVDLLKPLPFSSTAIVFFEIVSRSIMATLFSIAGAIILLIFKFELASFALASMILAPCLSILMSSAVFLVTMLFPDIEDVTQRQFRGLVTLLALAVLGTPPLLAFAGLFALKLWPALCATVAGLVCLGVSLAVAAASGSLYASYNPSE